MCRLNVMSECWVIVLRTSKTRYVGAGGTLPICIHILPFQIQADEEPFQEGRYWVRVSVCTTKLSAFNVAGLVLIVFFSMPNIFTWQSTAIK